MAHRILLEGKVWFFHFALTNRSVRSLLLADEYTFPVKKILEQGTLHMHLLHIAQYFTGRLVHGVPEEQISLEETTN